MASDKQKRKAAKKPRPAGVSFRHPDGDRRHRGGMTADQAARDKQARQMFVDGIPIELPPRESRRTGTTRRKPSADGIPEDPPPEVG
ncbi:MAG: hypothetical protein K2X82_08995 [Gemmataceae bacterium]|nr:hypothetical protein [Gemmataceae bacterium]